MSESRWISRPLALWIVLATTPVVMAKSPDRRAPSQRHASERIPVEHARVAQRPSPVAQAVQGRVVRAPASISLQGRSQNARQVGFLESYGSDCGPACDCDECMSEPGCGIDGGRLFEPGCGIGAALHALGPATCGYEPCECGHCEEASCGIDEMYFDDPACGMEALGDCSCDACSGYGVKRMPIWLPVCRVNWCRFDFFAGTQGFKGPLNFVNLGANNVRNGSGSFGFYQGFNEGRSLKRLFGVDLASQFGVRATQSNLSGADFTSDSRHQVFLTAGLFRKVDHGFQYGLVLDYLHQDWYFSGDAIQLRGETSWREECHVFGFQFMSGLARHNAAITFTDGGGNVLNSNIQIEPTNQYRFFYRKLLNQGGQCNLIGGWTDHRDGLLGASLDLPLRQKLVLNTSTTYLIPREGNATLGNQEEGWNVAMGLTFRPGGPKGCGRYCRPLFDVADNGTFMLDRR